MDYIEKLDLQTEEVQEVETLEKHTIINSGSVNKYNGHTRDFLALDEDYNDGFNQLNKTDGLGISCNVSKEVKEARKDVNGNFHNKLNDRIVSDINIIKSSLDNVEKYIKPKGKLNGVCFYFGNDTLEQFKIDIKRCKDEIGANSITLCVSVPYNFGTNNPTPVLIEWLDELIPHCKSIGLIPIVRCHTSPFGLDEENKNIWFPTNVDLWFTNLKNVV